MALPFERSSNMSVPGITSTPLEYSFGRKAATNASSQQNRVKSTSGLSQKPGTFRFFVVDNPAKLKDREQMRANRKHVMNDYLDKERQNPSSTDSRVTKISSGSRKRKQSEPPVSWQPVKKRAPQHALPQESTANHLAFGRGYISRSSPENYDLVASSIEQNDGYLTPQQVQNARAIRFVDIESSPDTATANEPRHSLSLTPQPSSYLGSNIQPFNTWPTLTDPLLNTEKLKWSCSRNFRSRGIAVRWIPTILKSRHAFLSTICISASHDDIMMRGNQAPHERAPFGSLDRMKVRGEIIGMVNDALNDPQTRLDDTTLVSILHLLNSELMGCVESAMRLHQRGLHKLVQQRGGLDRLGVGGCLASMTSVTMYMISALRETVPHNDFVEYGKRNSAKPPNDDCHLPESPLYCRSSGYHTIKKCLAPSSPAYELLETLRFLTVAFVRQSETTMISGRRKEHTNEHRHPGTRGVDSLCKDIFAVLPADAHSNDFATVSDKCGFEALRLTAVLYAFALSNGVPLSKAAAVLSDSIGGQRQAGLVTYHTLIKSALNRTDLSDAWGNMAGVLLWITLIAGACANPDSPSSPRSADAFSPDGGRTGEEEEARKWLAAVAVRCSIVLSFEYGGAMLETLRELVGIQQILAKTDAERTPRGLPPIEASGRVIEEGSNVPCGPEEPLWRTFQDYAHDFGNVR